MQIRVIDYSQTPPKPFATFTLDEGSGEVRCDDAGLLGWLEETGIALAEGGSVRVVHPSDGRAFLRALPQHFSGLLRAEATGAD